MTGASCRTATSSWATLLAALFLLGGCKDSGPSEEQRKAAQLALCDAQRPRVRAQWAELVALGNEVKALPPLEKQEPVKLRLALRELHFGEEPPATADAYALADLDGPKRGIIGSCLLRVEECKSDDSWLEESLKACASIDAAVVIRPTEERKPKPDEEGRRKYSGGFIRGEAFAFSLAGPDGGAATRLGAVTFETKLTGGVEIDRDFNASQIEHALNEGLRKSALRAIEARLNP